MLLGLLLLAAGLVGATWWWLQRPLPLAAHSIELSIEHGTAPREIAQGWVDAGVQTSPLLLYEWFRWSGLARRIRAGSYELSPGDTPRSLLTKMVRGDETLATARLIEGWTFRQFRAELARADGLKPTTSGMSDDEVMAALGLPGLPPEGRFYPDTYAYSKGSSDIAVLRRAQRAMQQRLDAAWAQRALDTPLRSADEALVLASIVEKETGAAADRPKVAAVFVNRLRIGMPLQTDPTVIYALAEGRGPLGRELTRADLEVASPYNTYRNPGLPPGAIANPGKGAIAAAVDPAPVDYLYFVASGEGGHRFASSLAEHNRNVARWRKLRKSPG